MGLDQAIKRMKPEIAEKIATSQENVDADVEGGLSDEEYNSIEDIWRGRKENHIRAAIERVTGVEAINCGYVFLNKEDVNELANRLLLVSEDHDRARVLLPTQDGFFFGSTEYDEYYFQDIERELLDFERMLEQWDESKVYAYWEWW